MTELLRNSRDLFGSERPAVHLPEEAASAVAYGVDGAADTTETQDLRALVAQRLKDSGAWAALAHELLAAGNTVEAYACARTGYHRGLDALRGNGWRGTGPVPWAHVPNRGVLAAIGALVSAAAALGEDDEVTRCLNLLHDCDPTATSHLGLTSLESS